MPMRSRSLARVGMAVVAVSGVITLGCGKPPAAPSPSGAPTPTPSASPSPSPPPFDLGAQSAQQRAAFALFEVAAAHAGATTSAIDWTTTDGFTFDPCVSGSMRASLDGGAPLPKGTRLPTGSHTYEVSFSDCWQGLGDIGLNGVASAAYSVATWSNGTATVSADSVRAHIFDYALDKEDYVTADGSAVWTWSSNGSTTYTPAPGSRLVKSSTGNVAAFGGCSYSTINSSTIISFQNSASKREWRFEGLKVAINGTEYTLAGSHDSTYTGEIRITSHGTLVARIYGDASGARIIEVLGPIVPF